MINWREVPLVRIVLALIAGILSADSGLGFFFFAVFFLLLSIIASAWLSIRSIAFQHRWIFGLTISVCWFCIGFVMYHLHMESGYRNHFGQFLDGEQIITGYAEDAPEDGRFIKLTMQVTGISEQADTVRPCFGRLLVYLKKDSIDDRIVHYGDQITFVGNVTPVSAALNPDAFDYRQYLFYKNIHHQIFVKSDQWELTGTGQGSAVWALAYICRDYCISVIRRFLGDGDEFAVASALLLGYDDAVSPELKQAYIQTGSMHILAVSGMHVGLIYLLLAQIFKRIRLRKKWWTFFEIITCLAIVWGFTLLTGASASVLRASTMFSFLIVGIKFKRFINIYNTLAASVLCLLLWNPFLIFDVGFQLSYAAVIGIVYFQPRVYKLLIFTNFAFDQVWQLTAVSFAAQLGTLPLSLYYFHTFPTWFWLSGLIAIPVSSLALYAGIAMLLVNMFSPMIAWYAGKAFYWLIWLMNQSIFMVQKFPLSVIKGIWLSGPEALLIFAVICILGLVIQTRKVRGLIFCFAGICLLIALSGFKGTKQYFRGELAIYYINKHTLIDWTEGFDVYSFSSPDLSQEKEDMAAQQHRWSNRINHLVHVSLDTTAAGHGFSYAAGLIRFRDKTLAIVDTLPATVPREIIPVDYLLIYGNAKVTIENILERYSPAAIIADGSNSRFKVAAWKKESANRQIPFYDLSATGAFLKIFD